MKQAIIFIGEVIEVLVIALVSVFIIRTFIVQPFLVRGASMEPNFSNGDYLLVDEISMRFRTPDRGEVVVFRFPRNPSTYYIKRIIGLPGESVRITENKVYILDSLSGEEFLLSEEYLGYDGTTGDSEITWQLGEEEYLVMGDNRSHSYDSRTWGPVSIGDIVGLARVRLWPIDEFSTFAAPAYLNSVIYD